MAIVNEGWYLIDPPTEPLFLVDRPVYPYPNSGHKSPVEIAYAHAFPDFSLGENTPGRISTLSPPVLFTPNARGWLCNLRWAGSHWDSIAPAALPFFRWPELDSGWFPVCNSGDAQRFFPLRGPGDFLQGGWRGLWDGGAWGEYSGWTKDSNIPPPTEPPDVTMLDMPNRGIEATYTYRLMQGESEPAPIKTILPYPGFSLDWHSPLILKLHAPTPPGIYGLNIYLRYIGEMQWHRQPWIWTSGLGYDLWPSWLSEYRLGRLVETGIGIEPADISQHRGWLNELQARAAFTDEADITTTKTTMPLACPFVSPLRAEGRAIGGQWGKVKFVVPQTVQGIPVPTRWDCVLQEEANNVEWRKITVRGDQGVHKIHAVAAWASHSYSAGNCFGPTLRSIDIVPNGAADMFGLRAKFDVGLCVSKYSNGQAYDPATGRPANDHTCSELKAEDVVFSARINSHVSGNQSVNFELVNHGCWGWRSGNDVPDDAGFHFDVQGGQFVITGKRFDPSQHATVFALDANCVVFVEGMFADNIGRALVTVGPNASGEVIFTKDGKLNCNYGSPRRMHVVEAVATAKPVSVKFGLCHGQDNGNVQYVMFGNDAQAVTATADPEGFFNEKVVKIVSGGIPQ